MKLFLRDHVPLMLFSLVQMILVPLLYALSGERRSLGVMMYGVLLSVVGMALYLAYRYLSHRALYRELSAEAQTAEAPLSTPPLGDVPLSEAVSLYNERLRRSYSEQLYASESRMEQHLVFVNRWVHQMKTPLSVIQLTLPELDDAPADSIRAEVERIRRGLEMVLYTARLERFEADFAVKPLLLREAVSKAVVDSRRFFIRSGITPELQIDPALAVYTDGKWFRFILDQLLTNAVNYSGASGKKVTISAGTEGEWVRLTIRDEGIGIRREDIGRVFQPYFTGERGRDYRESTGMGLYLVREIAERLEHRVELESTLGEGTAVTLHLRRVRQTSPTGGSKRMAAERLSG
jgi:signal transduction histidine kinase